MYVEMIGYVAGVFLIAMAASKSQFYMRIFNVAGSLCFVLYGLLAQVWPVLFLNVVMIAIHMYRLSTRNHDIKAPEFSSVRSG